MIQEHDKDVNIEPPRMGPFGAKILTVKSLREMLEGLDEHVQVVLDDGEEWYINVGSVIIPAGDPELQEFPCVTLFRGDPFDTRQI